MRYHECVEDFLALNKGTHPVKMKAITLRNIDILFIEAARDGDTDTVEFFLSQSGFDPLARDGMCYSALMWAARRGHEACVKLLLPMSDPLAQDNFGHSALMLAAAYGHEACVRLLLPVSDPLALDKEGRSASQMASDWGNFALADMINAYVLCLKEAAELSSDISAAPPRRAPVIRV